MRRGILRIFVACEEILDEKVHGVKENSYWEKMERLVVICIVLAQISAGFAFKTTIFTNSTDLERDDRSTNEGKLDTLLPIVPHSVINIFVSLFR